MMFLKTALLLAVTWSSVAADDATFTPYHISFKALKGGCKQSQDQLKEALATVGMVSVTDIGNDFRLQKQQTLSLLLDEECRQASSFSQEHVFEDGTRRRTLATHTINGEMKAASASSNNEQACEAFEQASTAFRHQVAEVTEVFAKRLESLLENVERPLLTTQSGETLDTIAQVVENGEHLEHFHSYYSSSSTPVEGNMDTIEMHTDQGMFLVFTPGQTPNNQELTDGFFIQLPDGSRVMVNFDQDDELVFLLGDGIHQVLSDNNDLYPTPHALQVTALDVRVWYGRMVLAPANAISPKHSDMTFGEIRNLMIENVRDGNDEVLSLGCSLPHQRALQTDEALCTLDQLWCWHRCQNLTDVVSEDACAITDLDLACINSERQLWADAHNPDFKPGCVDLDTARVAGAPTASPSSAGSEAEPDGAVMTSTLWTLVVASVFAALRLW
jgi:hypothetical protein